MQCATYGRRFQSKETGKTFGNIIHLTEQGASKATCFFNVYAVVMLVYCWCACCIYIYSPTLNERRTSICSRASCSRSRCLAGELLAQEIKKTNLLSLSIRYSSLSTLFHPRLLGEAQNRDDDGKEANNNDVMCHRRRRRVVSGNSF